MGRYVLSKIFQSAIVVFIVSVIIFGIIEILPGDISASLITDEVTDVEAEMIREKYGLNKTPIERYMTWAGKALRGDLGNSFTSKEPVFQKVMHAMGITLKFTLISLVIGTLIGIVFGVIAAVNRGKALDSLISVCANICNAAPSFWFAVVLILVFAVELKWLPVQGYTPLSEDLVKGLRQMVLPCLVLMLPTIASITRQTRSAMLEVLNQEYVRTARSKGQKERVVIFKHVLKNALIPVLTVLGMRLNSCFAGAMISESVFGVPGMGSVIMTAVMSQDPDLLMGCTIIMCIVVVFTTLLVDIAYGIVDPRMRNTR